MTRLHVLLVAAIALSSCASLVTSQDATPNASPPSPEKVIVWVPEPAGTNDNRRLSPDSGREYSTQFAWPDSSTRRVAAPSSPDYNTDFGWPSPDNSNRRVAAPKSPDYNTDFGWPSPDNSNRRVAARNTSPLYSPPPSPQASSKKPASNCSIKVKKYGRCGRKAPLKGYCCVKGTTCTKVALRKWTCRPKKK